MTFRAAAAASPLALLIALAAQAEETRHAEAHEHGVSVLQLALEGEELAVELRSPGADIVGFEHEATSAEDKAAVEAALKTLRAPAGLFGLSCELEKVEAHVDGHGDDHHGEGHDEDHEEHAHEDGHDDDHKEHAQEDGHDDDHDHEAHADGAVHSEFHAIYAFHCHDAPAGLDLTGFFAAFPNAREVELQAVSAKGAFAAELTPAAPKAALR